MYQNTPAKRMLVISNEPFCSGSSNGRTLMNLLKNYDKQSLAQFYLHGTPDLEFCSRYFHVSDRDALNAFLHRKKTHSAPAASQGKREGEKPAGEKPVGEKPALSRSCRNLYFRDLIWDSRAWWSRDFDAFLEAFAPQVVLIQGGDAPFLFALACRIARKYSAKLMQFTTENYVLKRYMYSDGDKEKFWHFFLKNRMKRRYAAFMKQASYNIYSTEQLEADYQQRYPHPGKSVVLYTVTELLDLPKPERAENDHFRVVYCGNLGVGRAQPLAQLAGVLHQVDPQAVLEIYGRFVDGGDKKLVCSQPGVDYRGMIPYDEVPGLLQGADMILHCENPERLVNLRTAFSTKIADSLAVGTPFLVYADKRYPFVQYLLKNRCAHVAQDTEELKTVLTACRNDTEYRRQYVEQALATARRNHSAQQNCARFNQIVEQL